jgi:hypothetical protein
LNQNTSAIEAETALTNVVAIASAADCVDPVFASLGATLAEIRKLEGVLGYILRGNTSAILDLEPDKVSQYAVLSCQLDKPCLETAEQLKVAEIESVLVEGGNLKVLCIRIAENKISVIMEKSASHSSIIKRLLI